MGSHLRGHTFSFTRCSVNGYWRTFLPNTVGDTPTSVTVAVYPIAPADVLSNPTLMINNTQRSFTSATGNYPLLLTFNVGGDSAEAEGGVNKITITVTDNGGYGEYPHV